MTVLRATSRLAVPARAAAAGLLATVVFALGLLAAAPSAHDWLHATHTHHAVAHDDAACAVTLFSQGATAPCELPRISAPPAVFAAPLHPAPARPLLAAQTHLTPPGCGPPCIG